MGERVQRGQSRLLCARLKVLDATKGTPRLDGQLRLGEATQLAFLFQHITKRLRKGHFIHNTGT